MPAQRGGHRHQLGELLVTQRKRRHLWPPAGLTDYLSRMMSTITIEAVATAMEAAQAAAQVGREAVELDSVLWELHRLLQAVSACP